MAVEAGAVRPSGAVEDSVRPYQPGWTDLLIGWIRGLPWPRWLTYVVLIAIGVLISNAQSVLSGHPFEITFTQTAWGIVTVGFLAALDALNQVAGSTFDAFRPALGESDLNEARARYELTTVPRIQALAILLVAGPFTAFYYVQDPIASQVAGLGPAALAGRWLFESFFTALLLVLIVQAVRQLRLVSRLHAAATRIDPFHPAPLYAFSRLTALTGCALVGVIALGVALNPASLSANSFVLVWLPWLVAFPGVALLVFLAPLTGMHGRLQRIKGSLQAESEDRIKAVLHELHRDVDQLQLGRADGLQKTLGSLLQERDLLAKLPTWPWSTGTIRGFVTALLLPVVVFLLQRFAGGLLT